MSEPFCPHCGYNLKQDEVIESGPWRIAPWSIELDGRGVRLSGHLLSILHTIASAQGRTVTYGTIVERAGFEDLNLNSLRVFICRIRAALPGVPIENAHGVGYRWAYAPEMQVAA